MSNITSEGLEDEYRSNDALCTTHATVLEKRGVTAEVRGNYAHKSLIIHSPFTNPLITKRNSGTTDIIIGSPTEIVRYNRCVSWHPGSERWA